MAEVFCDHGRGVTFCPQCRTAKPSAEVGELIARLRRYPAIRENAWKAYERGYCYDDEADNGPITDLVLQAADAIEALSALASKATKEKP
jgi:hypothetical protein